MIGVDMCIEDVRESESELREQLDITIDLIPHWIDDESELRSRITYDIGVCRTLLVEELAEDERRIHKNLVKIARSERLSDLDDI